MAATETLRIIVESKKKGTGAEESKKGLEGLKKAAALAAAAFGAMKAAQGAIDFLKLGAQVEAVGARFRAFSGSAEAAEGYLTAMGRASDYTLDKMSAMAGASKMLQMGLVSNSAEMETMAAIAIKLGDQTVAAGDRIADFSALLANRSVPRLDNFGLASGRVRQRVEELKDAGYGLDEAFKLAVLEEGEKSLARLGDTSELTATKIARVEAQLTDLKNTSAGTFASIVADTGALDWLNERLGMLPTTLNQVTTLYNAYSTAVKAAGNNIWKVGEAVEVFNGQLRANAINQNNLYQATEQTRYAYTALGEGTAALVAEQQREVEIQQALAAASVGAVNTFAAYNAALASEVAAQEAATHATNMHREAMAQIAAQAVETQGYILDVGMSWTSHFDSVAEQAATFADKMTGIEEEHQARVKDITDKGQATLVQINEAAEQKKLEILQQKLALRLQQQSEFTDKTKESTRMAKEAQIATLQEQVAQQAQLLDDYHAGRLVRQGENITTELAAEQARYAEELALMQAEQAKQEEMQRASLGRMVLQAFDAWASMKGIAAGDALEMRTAIAKEYGLIDAETARTVSSMVSLWESWADGTGRSAGETIASMQRVIGKADATRSAIERIPAMRRTRHEHTEVKIKITRRKEEGSAGGGIPEGAQQGTMYSPGGMTLVGERGAEMMYVPRGAKIYDAMKTRGMQMGGGGIGINATFNIYPAAGMDEEGLARKVMRVMDVKLLRNRVAQQARLRGQGRGLLG